MTADAEVRITKGRNAETRSAEGASGVKNRGADRLVERIARSAEAHSQGGDPKTAYWSTITQGAVAGVRDVKGRLSSVLHESHERPQVVTVRGRGNRPSQAYVIVPANVVADLLDMATEREAHERSRFVPITQIMRDCDDYGGLKPSSMPQRKRRGRPDSAAVTAGPRR